MRFKKQKRHRKAVRFFSVCFGFRQPFKVLCDGTFVHHLLVHNITPADKALSDCLCAPVKLFTTRCVLVELKRLGHSHITALQAANKLAVARCDHEKIKSADACIRDVIGENNPEHFFVATQDTGIRDRLQEVPGVPLIFGLRNALFLEQPSEFQREFVKSSEEKRLHMTNKEQKLLEKRTQSIVANEDVEENCNDIEGLGCHDPGLHTFNTRKHTSEQSTHLKDRKDRVQFKRKKAKGPNPLSCKKKMNRDKQNPRLGKEIKEGDSIAKSRSRKRKRSRKDQKES